MPYDEHRDSSPVDAVVPDLLGREIICVQALKLRGSVNTPPRFFGGLRKIIMSDRARRCETTECCKEPTLIAARRNFDLAYEIRCQSLQALPRQVVKVQLVYNLEWVRTT